MKAAFRLNGIRVRQRGQGMTEYIIITALIAIAAISAAAYFGGTVRAQVGGMAQELSGKNAASSISDAGKQSAAASRRRPGGQGPGHVQQRRAQALTSRRGMTVRAVATFVA